MRKKKEQTVEALVGEIRHAVKHWKDVKAHGTTDPFYADGVNLNLIRYHVIYFKGLLKEACKTQKVRPCPSESKVKIPRKLSKDYMAPGSKAGAHR